MQNPTLKKFLENTRYHLMASISDCSEDLLLFPDNEELKLNLTLYESQLNLIKSIIDLCEARNRY